MHMRIVSGANTDQLKLPNFSTKNVSFLSDPNLLPTKR